MITLELTISYFNNNELTHFCIKICNLLTPETFVISFRNPEFLGIRIHTVFWDPKFLNCYSQLLTMYFQLLIILCMESFGSCANFRLPVFGGFTRFGVWRIQKTQNQPVFGFSLVNILVCQSVETIPFEQIVVKTSFRFYK